MWILMSTPCPSHPLRYAIAFLVAIGSVVVGPAALASVQDEMREMREMVLKLQDQVDAQERQIDDQRDVIRDSGLDERGSASGLGSFLESTDFRGWVSASYFYNVNDPRSVSASAGESANGPFSNPFHADHNSFQLDEVWLVVDRAASAESPAGFHFEIVYGATASAIQGDTANLNGNDLWIPSANVSYRTPWGPTVTAGKFATTIGYEVAGAPNNINITRGFVYNLFQPISHTGVTASQSFDNGLRYTLGVVNGFGTEQPDSNDDKGFLWQLGWGNDTGTVLFNGIYEDNGAGSVDSRYVLDLVGEMTPAENVLLWLNFDYLETDLSGGDPWAVGIAAGGRVGVTDRLGVGTRVEYAHLDADGVLTFSDGNGNARLFDGDLWSFTGTLDYALTDDMTGKVEAKYEKGRSGLGNSYKDGSSGSSDDALFLGTQLYYEF
jgi:hypothetical protein